MRRNLRIELERLTTPQFAESVDCALCERPFVLGLVSARALTDERMDAGEVCPECVMWFGSGPMGEAKPEKYPGEEDFVRLAAEWGTPEYASKEEADAAWRAQVEAWERAERGSNTMISENIGREIREGWESFDPRERDPRAEELADAAERLSANLAVTREWVKAATEGGPETGELLEDAYAAYDLIEKELAKVRADLEVFRRSRRRSGLGLTPEQEEELSRMITCRAPTAATRCMAAPTTTGSGATSATIASMSPGTPATATTSTAGRVPTQRISTRTTR